MLKIIRLNKKDFFNNFEILNSKIEKIDERKKKNISLSLFFSFDFDTLNSKIKKIDKTKKDNFLSLLNKKKNFFDFKTKYLKKSRNNFAFSNII